MSKATLIFIAAIICVVGAGVWISWRGHNEVVKKGDKFQALVDIDTLIGIDYAAPYGDALNGRVPAGTIIVAMHDGAPMSKGVNCVPEDYKRLEMQLIPEQIRGKKYAGYSVLLMYSDIGKRYKRI